MEMFVWLVRQISTKDELRSVSMEFGGLSVMMVGTAEKQLLYASRRGLALQVT